MPAPERPADRADTDASSPGALPEIDFATFAMSLASSVLMYLGELQEPGEARQAADLPLAKQTIDILGMLADKTRGNLSDEEHKLLEHLLLDLRMKYVEATKRK
jgi:hypothetical protein